jgi:hypothetical protein
VIQPSTLGRGDLTQARNLNASLVANFEHGEAGSRT